MTLRIKSKKYGGCAERYVEASGVIKDSLPYPRWVSLGVVKYTDLNTTAGLTKTLDVATLPAGTVIHAVVANLKTLFAGTTTLQVDLGVSGTAEAYLKDMDLKASSGYKGITTGLGTRLYDATNKGLYYVVGSSNETLQALFTATVDNLTSLTQGEIELFVLISNPSAAWQGCKYGDSTIL